MSMVRKKFIRYSRVSKSIKSIQACVQMLILRVWKFIDLEINVPTTKN